MKKILLTLVTSTLLLSAPLKAETEEEKKAPAKFSMCAACHGAKGISSVPMYPNLAGQQKQYLITALNDYKNGKRTGSMAMMMKPQADMLSDNDIKELAEYLSSLK